MRARKLVESRQVVEVMSFRSTFGGYNYYYISML